jgi:xanthine dehydrogenase molybdopterin-binding subunit B
MALPCVYININNSSSCVWSSQVRMRRAGGAFGAKATRNLPHAAAAAVAAKVRQQPSSSKQQCQAVHGDDHDVAHVTQVMRRPVRLTLDRETDMQLTGGRHAMEAEYEAAFHADSGRLEALKLNVWLNGGFCLDLSFTPCHDLTVNLEQAYYVPHAAFDVEVLRTNLPTSTAMRAPGVAQASFIMESVMDHIAAATGLGGEAVREANFFGGSEQRMGSAGCLHLPPAPVAHWTLPRIWERLRASAGLASRREQAAAFNAQSRWRKRGVAMTPVKFLVPLQPMAATLNAYPDGSVLVHHGGCELGQGIHAKTALVALDVLGAVAPHAPLTLDMIRFADTDTDSIPNGGYTAGSTTSERACAAVHAAALEMARRLEPVKQRLLAASPDGQPPAWAALVAAALAMGTQVDLCCHAEYRPEQGAEFYHNYGAAVAEVEVDALTGEVDLRAAHVLYDCGKSVNPAADMGQVEGAFVQGLGFFLTEEALIGSDGTLVSPGTWEYKPPLWTDLPSEWRVELLENGGFDKGFLSSKASGEPPLVLATSVMMAVREAVGAAREEAGLSRAGFRLDAPATAERVHRACGTHMGLLTLAEGGRGVWLDQAPREVIDVAVAGAGLGGLAMGIALKKVGLDARLFERAHALRDVSQGLVGITPNGLRALELIDPRLKEYLFEKGKYNTEAFTKTVDVAGSSERTVTFEANNLSIPWADIQHSLARLVPREMICCSHDFAGACDCQSLMLPARAMQSQPCVRSSRLLRSMAPRRGVQDLTVPSLPRRACRLRGGRGRRDGVLQGPRGDGAGQAADRRGRALQQRAQGGHAPARAGRG